jgi:hypothetical protein
MPAGPPILPDMLLNSIIWVVLLPAKSCLFSFFHSLKTRFGPNKTTGGVISFRWDHDNVTSERIEALQAALQLIDPSEHRLAATELANKKIKVSTFCAQKVNQFKHLINHFDHVLLVLFGSLLIYCYFKCDNCKWFYYRITILLPTRPRGYNFFSSAAPLHWQKRPTYMT